MGFLTLASLIGCTRLASMLSGFTRKEVTWCEERIYPHWDFEVKLFLIIVFRSNKSVIYNIKINMNACKFLSNRQIQNLNVYILKLVFDFSTSVSGTGKTCRKKK